MFSAFRDAFHRRQRHYQEGPRVYAERGTPYPCTQAAIDELQDTQLHPRTEPDTHMSMGEATRRLENAHRSGNPLNAGQKAALQRLQDLEKVGKYGPDIVFKIFNDLDTLLFHGALNGNVYLRWSSTDEFIRQNGYGEASGRTSQPGFVAMRVGIQLNEGVLQLSTTRLRDVISTLVHECIHAYLMVIRGDAVGPEDAGTDNPGHGRKFMRCMRAVSNRLGGSDYVSLVVCHSLIGRSPSASKWKSGFTRIASVEKEQQRRHNRGRGRSGW